MLYNPMYVEEEEVITETSVAMFIDDLEAHKVVMTTIKSEETTLDNLSTTEPFKTTTNVGMTTTIHI